MSLRHCTRKLPTTWTLSLAIDPPHAPGWQYYLNPWWRQHEQYVSPLTPAECRQVINASTAVFLGRSVGRGLLSTADFTLHRISFVQNGFRPYAYVKLTERATGGTLVSVTLSASRPVQAFSVIWLGFVATVTILATIGEATQRSAWIEPAGFGGGMIAFFLTVNAIGRLAALRDSAFLRGFLGEELHLQASPY